MKILDRINPRLLIVVICLIIPNKSSFSCSCSYFSSICQAFNSAESIYIGTVAKVEDVKVLRNIKSYDNKGNLLTIPVMGSKYYIIVEKTFKGKPQSEIVLAEDNSDCATRFIIGSKLLLYTRFDKELGMWILPSCGRPIYVKEAQDDLKFLNGLPGNLGRTRISGTLYKEESEKDYSILARTKVVIKSKDRTIELFTNQDGVYEIIGLPAGEYSIVPISPDYLKINDSISYGAPVNSGSPRNQTITISLINKSCASVNYFFK
jgi:hypothetical protein